MYIDFSFFLSPGTRTVIKLVGRGAHPIQNHFVSPKISRKHLSCSKLLSLSKENIKYFGNNWVLNLSFDNSI